MKKITSMILALVFAVSLIGSASAKTLNKPNKKFYIYINIRLISCLIKT